MKAKKERKEVLCWNLLDFQRINSLPITIHHNKNKSSFQVIINILAKQTN